jgi:uncharacterized circularly permuted ATP-grasp superfamily protein
MSIPLKTTDPRASVRTLDSAKGVLVALRRCSLDDAFHEILHVAEDYHVGVLSLCQALIALATKTSVEPWTPADNAAHQAWKPLFE